MATTRFVYRSGAKDILEEFEKCSEDQRKWRRKSRRLINSWFPELDRATRKEMVVVYTAGWGNVTWLGVSCPWGKRREILEAHPEWKEDKDGHLTPRLSDKEGKKIKAIMADNPMPNIRQRLRGMPSHIFTGMSSMQPGVDFLDGKVYVIWSCQLDGDDETKGFDPKTWRPVKLSEYYRLIEKRDEAEKTA